MTEDPRLRRPRSAVFPGRIAAPAVILALFAAACQTAPAPPGPTTPPLCTSCFWESRPPTLRADLAEYYRTHPPADPLERADVHYLLARMDEDSGAICATLREFEALAQDGDACRRLFAAETVAFLARDCGRDPRPLFRQAQREARDCGEPHRAEVYRQLAGRGFSPRFGEETIQLRLKPAPDARAVILGESEFRIRPGMKIGVQVERVVRDWLSSQMQHGFSRRPPAPADIIPWHEGARVRDILAGVPVEVVPLWGAIAARRGDRWYGPDERGVFRFVIGQDKLLYPTNRVRGDVALIEDTHGFSALVPQAIAHQVDLVIACGDNVGKMQAAYHLARRGIAAYFPCDRFVDEVLGNDAPAPLIGSAPVRREPGGVVVGGRPLWLRTDELIVVEDTDSDSRARYYNAPARYFRRLAEFVPLRLEFASIREVGETGRVVERAQALSASAIAVRVETDADAAPVRAWLAASPDHRAVLFHSAAYPPGNQLFIDFPVQTTFGDPQPRFLRADHAHAALVADAR